MTLGSVALIAAAIGVAFWTAKTIPAENYGTPSAENPREHHALRRQHEVMAADISEASVSLASTPARIERLKTGDPLKENRPIPAKLPQIAVATALYTGLSDPDFSKMDAHEQAAVSELGAYALEAMQTLDTTPQPLETNLADEKDQITSEIDECLRLSLGQDRFNKLSFLAAANRYHSTQFQPNPQQ